jgi:hypothetical protein
MVVDFLVPGVKDLYNPGNSAEIPFVSGEFKQRPGRTSVKEAVEKALVAQEQGIQLMRECKNHMKVRGVNNLCPPFVHPERFVNGLTVRAAAVAAGIVMEFQVAAVGTL